MPDILPEAPPSNHKRNKALIAFTLLILLLAALWLSYWLLVLRYEESTDDAYVNGNLININPVIPGAVTAFFADNNDFVKEGQLLVSLDDTPYRAVFQKEIANLGTAALQVRKILDTVQINREIVETKKTFLERAKIDYQSRLNLRKSKPEAVAHEDFLHSKQDYLGALYAFKQSEAQLQEASAAAGHSPPAQHPLIEQQKASVLTAFYNLQHCSIYAPSIGYVAQRTVDVGEWITPETNLMAIIPPTNMWVDANFKETQLSGMRIGQPASVWFDLYGKSIKYEGAVQGIGMGTGSVFSLIPPQNATGNWIKIVQRIPVRILLNSEKLREFPPRLGISAEVTVDITDQNLPFLAPSPTSSVVSQTDVLKIDLQQLEKMMDEIVQQQLRRPLNQEPSHDSSGV